MSDLFGRTPPSDIVAADVPTPEIPRALHLQQNAEPGAAYYHGEPAFQPFQEQAVPIATAEPVTEYWSDQNQVTIQREYEDMKRAAAAFWPSNPEQQKAEQERVQLSFYVGQRLRVPPVDVFKAWTNKGANPYVEQYFGATDLPQSWGGNMRDEIVRTLQTYKATNMAAAMVVQPYDEAKVEELWKVLQECQSPSA